MTGGLFLSLFLGKSATYTRGGERGIRTLETLQTLTHFPGVLLKPLGHLTVLLTYRALFTEKDHQSTFFTQQWRLH